MSIPAIEWALKQDVGDPIAKLILISLSNAFNGKTGRCFPSFQHLVRESGSSRSTVIRKLQFLEENGWIKINTVFDDDGRQTANNYELGCQTDTGEGSNLTRGGCHSYDTGEGVSCDTPYKEPEEVTGKSILSETSSDHPSKTKKGFSYPDEFNLAWSEYPTSPNMSKREAFDAWKKLDPDDREALRKAIPEYRAFLAKKPDLEVKHMVGFIKRRRFDGFAQSSKPEQSASPDDWRKRMIHARRDAIWASDQWGPRPGEPGCLVPQELITAGDGKNWKEWGADH